VVVVVVVGVFGEAWVCGCEFRHGFVKEIYGFGFGRNLFAVML
jgi:hypothetical protein